MSVAEIFESMDYGPAPESRAAVDDWLAGHDRRFGLFIGGKWVDPKSGDGFDSLNPATGEILGRIAQAGPEDVAAAVAAARRAQPAWAGLGGHGRARHLYALARLVQKHARFLAVLETLDNGKPIRETRDIDVPLVARHFYHHAGWAQLMERELPDQVPHGVVGQAVGQGGYPESGIALGKEAVVVPVVAPLALRARVLEVIEGPHQALVLPEAAIRDRLVQDQNLKIPCGSEPPGDMRGRAQRQQHQDQSRQPALGATTPDRKNQNGHGPSFPNGVPPAPA